MIAKEQDAAAIEWTPAPRDRDPGVYNGGLRYLVAGEVRGWKGTNCDVLSPVHERAGAELEPRNLGKFALLSADAAKEAVEAAAKAYDAGRGEWPTAGVTDRIRCVETFLKRMEEKRIEAGRLLCWEIGKTWEDSLAEYDRTVAYGRDTVAALKNLDRDASRFALNSGFLAQIRRSPYGVALCMGPYNYPFNETFTTLLPALIMGNTVIVKLPRLGMLCNLPLLEAFAQSFPPGVVNIIGGDGATVVTPIIQSGKVDLLAFIGSPKVANILKKAHPKANRLRCILGLGAKNPAVVLPDADMEPTVREIVAGALTFNGQRCTALKIIFVHRPMAEKFVSAVCEAVNALPRGMPFMDKTFLTPLPEMREVERISEYVADALAKGARVRNAGGGKSDHTYFHPAVVYPVKKGMRLWEEEQFGPIVAIAPYDEPDEALDYLAESPYGQQASIFGKDPKATGRLVDAMVNQVCRVNVNSQCRRGPDTYPFGGRKDSAEGTLSITDALRVFSIRTIVAAKETPENVALVREIIRGRHSRFLNTDYLF
ncbi:MAG: aldehyde dehydrogenase family protein [Elusimicrobia bacterium]|nr:aldehyde dehydrogenase family protein [Elusimicrobiota bacterium]